MTVWEDLVNNRVFITAILAWFLGQFLKVPIEYLTKRRWNWALWFSSGGMPSSHSSLMVATTLSIGLYYGFDSPLFALAFAVSMIVVYDAAGVRRQAGYHAQKINLLFEELFSGHPISQERLKEVLGHTPRQVIGGIVLGTLIALIVYGLWPPVNP
ncbi:divergent PAP2 family protein [Bellilinea sp.]|jgi:acid phosphatase family membrane protein YuiD|uniref:Divergent PAP2 family protein n=1 Tax=Bellilinea caldifistulae TaxID=360411 RepID=A0A7C4Q332_9CHLR|nr:divergent PAP2 family protein [Bellilinea sp.]